VKQHTLNVSAPRLFAKFISNPNSFGSV